MQLVPITAEERKILIAMAVGYFLVLLAVVGWIIYILAFGKGRLSALAYPALLLVIFIVLFAQRVIKMYSDILIRHVVEGVGEVMHRGGEVTRDDYIVLDVIGKDKIKLQRQRKDMWRLQKGDKIRFRIAPKSRLLMNFSLVVDSPAVA